jgi:membrane protease YdiL (CAAX protease family)
MAGLCAAVFLLALAIRRQPLRSAFGSNTQMRVALELGLALALLTIFLRGKVNILIYHLPADALTNLGLCAAISLLEEAMFRGYIQLRLNSWLGPRYGWLLTALLFFIWQLPRLAIDPASLWIRLGLAAAQALLLGWVMQKSRHAFAPAIYRTISMWAGLL